VGKLAAEPGVLVGERSTGTTGTSSSPSTVYDSVPDEGITTGCTSIDSSLRNVMDKAGDNHARGATREPERTGARR
jgi:hypothetical protein